MFDSTEIRFQTAGSLALTARPAGDSTQLRVLEGGLSDASLRNRVSPRTKATEVSDTKDRHARNAHRDMVARSCGAAAIVLLLVFALVGCWTAGTVQAQAAYQEMTASVPEQSVSVRAGEGLLKIASAHPITGLSTRQTADWITSRNGLDPSVPLQVGQSLVVPR